MEGQKLTANDPTPVDDQTAFLRKQLPRMETKTIDKMDSQFCVALR